MFKSDDYLLIIDSSVLFSNNARINDQIKMMKNINQLFTEYNNLYLGILNNSDVVKKHMKMFGFNKFNSIIKINLNKYNDLTVFFKQYNVKKYLIVAPVDYQNLEYIKTQYITSFIFDEIKNDNNNLNFKWRQSILNIMMQENISWVELGKRLKRNPSNIRKTVMFHNITMNTLVKIFNALGYNIKFYIEKGEFKKNGLS